MKPAMDFQGCVDVVAVFALLIVLFVVFAYLLYRRITDDIHFGKDSPPGDVEQEDLLEVPLEECDICPSCKIGILTVQKTESNPEEVTIGTYYLKCSHCPATFPDG